MSDAYAVLGLVPGAGRREVTRAFRRLAMRWHPDRNADPAAIEHFKVLRAAYERLLDELGDEDAHERPHRPHAERSARGDARREPPPGHDAPPHRESHRHDAPPRGSDRREVLELTLEEAWGGCEKVVRRESFVPCATCHGSGEVALTHSRMCEACHGSGKLRNGRGLLACEACGGRGYSKRQACPDCGGHGRKGNARSISLRVPPGVLPGDELRLAGEGDKSPGGHGRAGDLLLRVALAPHPLFRLDGRDVVLSRPISALRMLLGGDIEVPVPGGVRCVPVAPGPAEIREIRVEDAGFPGRRGERTGALRVSLVPVMPRAEAALLRELMAQVEAEVVRDPARHAPELARWEAQWLKK